MNIEIADRLVKMRKAHGFSQEELADKLGISRQAVSKWERAESSPDTDNLIMLSRLYGVSLDSLLATEDEIPRPEPEPAEKAPDQTVHISLTHGINVRDDDGSGVHIGWDGIRVREAGDEEEDEQDGDSDINTYINDIRDVEVGPDGVSFTADGERVFREWNETTESGKRFYRTSFRRPDGTWRTVIIKDDGRKVVMDTNKKPKGETVESGGSGSFPFTVFVTGAFLLLGFLGGWWHPAWMLFLTIPIYHAVSGAIRKKRFSALDVIVPVAIAGGYCALGLLYGLWHPLWLMLLAIPLYYLISAAVSKKQSGSGLTGIYAIIVTAAYLALGFAFGQPAWSTGWLLYLTVPMFSSVVASVRKKEGLRGLWSFPWELLILGGYLFVGLMFGIWHPTWVAFVLIPVLRWAISKISGTKWEVRFSGGTDDEEHEEDDDE